MQEPGPLTRKPAHTSRPASPKGQTAETRTAVLQPIEQKPHSQKVREDGTVKNMSQRKAQDKTPEEQLSELETGNLPEK